MNKIIVALDNMSEEVAINIISKISSFRRKTNDSLIWGFKINDLLIDCGLSIVRKIKDMGFKVMADPKLYDITNTMKNSLNKLINAGSDIVTVHCSAKFQPKQNEEHITSSNNIFETINLINEHITKGEVDGHIHDNS